MTFKANEYYTVKRSKISVIVLRNKLLEYADNLVLMEE